MYEVVNRLKSSIIYDRKENINILCYDDLITLTEKEDDLQTFHFEKSSL